MEDRYEILDVVARGAMATVWRAQDVRLGRIVAIKRLHAPSAGSNASAFTDTARSSAAVTHPNLITIFDTGTDDTGPYLVMEFVDGPTLAEMGGAPHGAATLGSEIASGLSALHAAGIVHRDVRPSNILLGPTGAKLTDFATARANDAGTRPSVTAPRFEAPEVLAGGEPDSAADVYSLGAILSWVADQSAPDPELSSIIERAMATEPETRPTAATLAEHLHRITPGAVAAVKALPVSDAPPGADATQVFDGPLAPAEPPDSEAGSPKRGRRIAATIAIVLLALIVAILALPSDDEPAPLADETTIVETTVGDATTSAPAAAGTDIAPTTEPEETGGVFNTVRIFVTFIRETPREILTRSGAEEIISDVADGVSEAIRGNAEDAESSLGNAVETVQEEIQSESIVDRAIELISRLARQLGLDADRVVEPSQ